ncbi:(2Fe-2S)-binding protein [Paenibacillus alkaliterrae]|uniref:(2Fe-2S)-binding protein n=1 Tax=Paenibacillus alkaliterrae TaxID=320909 RepID=UPI001F2EF2FC|nr:(2Fe-2S)-binding protein [Paenibacillus alkaliterrae]MCF2938671.1 (2Fe-2S)-binding protein [Paenibacillus alkaliterrae]
MVPFDLPLLQNRFNISFEACTNKEAKESITLDSEEQFVYLLKRFGEGLNTSNRGVIGSLFIKRYGALIAGGLYLWTHHQIGFDMSVEKVKITVNGSGLNFHIADAVTFNPLKSVHEPKQKNDMYIGHLLSENVNPVFAKTVYHTGIRESNLWATLSYLLAYWKKEWIRSAESSEIRSNIENAFRVMTEQYNPEWFPGKAANPIISRFRSIDDPLHEGQHILLREKCCLNYRLPGEDRYCYTCPLISDEKRIEKYLAAHAGEHQPISAQGKT